MPDLSMELSHLEQADRHIAQAEGNIARIAAQLADAAVGTNRKESEATLQVIQGTLAAFREHRALIVHTIQDIRYGRFG